MLSLSKLRISGGGGRVKGCNGEVSSAEVQMKRKFNGQLSQMRQAPDTEKQHRATILYPLRTDANEGSQEMSTLILPDQPDADYRKAEGINWSVLKDYIGKTPAHAVGSERKDKIHFDVGHAIHTGILEPFDFEARFVKGPEDRRGNRWKDAYAAAQSNNKTLLVEDDYEDVLRVRDAAHANPDINKLVSSNNRTAETSGYWERDGIACKCRWDLVVDDGAIVADLKSTVSAGAIDFAKSVSNFGYHGQEGWYSGGAAYCYGPTPIFLFIAVEKDPPYASAVYELDAVTKREGLALADAAFDLFKRCQENQEWPGYPGGIQQLTLPRWAFRMTGK